MSTASDHKPEQIQKKRFRLYWYHGTRAIGAVMVFYGLLADHSPDRGTIILTGAGLLGIDKVARSDPESK